MQEMDQPETMDEQAKDQPQQPGEPPGSPPAPLALEEKVEVGRRPDLGPACLLGLRLCKDGSERLLVWPPPLSFRPTRWRQRKWRLQKKDPKK